MSTSLAVQPALRTTKTERSKAYPNRTIFGTTLDNYTKCWNLLSNQKVIEEATHLHEKNSTWKSQYPPPQTIIEKAWKSRALRLGESNFDLLDCNKQAKNRSTIPATVTAKSVNIGFEKNKKDSSTSPSAKTYSRSRQSVLSNRSTVLSNSKQTRPSPGLNKSVATENSFPKRRPMSEPVKGRRPPGRATKVRVPKFRLAPGSTNFMKTSSMKITETGAKDILHSQPINKIGLGDTLQYDYHTFQRRETPKFYRDNGHVLLLGQKFTSKTTNQEENGPGGFYEANGPDRYINENFRYVKDRSSENTMHRHLHNEGKGEVVVQKQIEGQNKHVKYEVPLNILHKYGENNVSTALQENQDEFLEVLEKQSDMKHSALVPPRLDVKELNHPIDPPTTYFTNFGENLKYDKFEGGLHLYIK